MAAQDHDQNTTVLPGLRPNRNDPLHDLQLLRDLDIFNTCTARALGPLPPGGLPLQPKRKPDLPKPVRSRPEIPLMTSSPTLLRNGLPPPPVPRRLRECLKDHPEHLTKLQDALNAYVSQRERPWRFDGAIWAIDDVLGEFILEVRAEGRARQAAGHPDAIKEANAEEKPFFHAYNKSGWASDVQELWDYFQLHADAFNNDPPPALDNGRPPPPVTPWLRERLKDYPGYFAKLQRRLYTVANDPKKANATPSELLEYADWGLEGALESFVGEAREELDTAEASGYAEAIERAEKKELFMSHSLGAGRAGRIDGALMDYFGVPRGVASHGK